MSSAPAVSSLDEFRAAVSRGSTAVEGANVGRSFEIDGLSPRCVVRPQDESGVAEVLSEARSRGLAVIATGGGQHRSIGNVPRAYDVALDTAGLQATLDHEPEDLTVTADAGVRFGDLSAALAKRGQWLPIDAPVDATVGGLLAVNASGPLRHAYGTLRDWLIGLRVAHPDGSMSKSGGRVVKNVAGYDMHKLHIGALGTLGCITQATFKLSALPARNVAARGGFVSASEACAFVLAARDRRLSMITAEVAFRTDSVHATPWSVAMTIAGSQAAVERSMRDLRGLAGEHGMTIEFAEQAAQLGSAGSRAPAIVLRIGVLPSRVASTLMELSKLDGGALLTATVCVGTIRCSVLDPDVDARAFVERVRGSVGADGMLFVECAPLEVKREIDVFGPPRADWKIMRQLKQEFDPAGTLSPGRFAGRI